MRDQRAEVSLSISPGEQLESEPLEPRDFRLLVLGDLSGRGDDAPLSIDLPRRVDRDDLDAVLARIGPRLRVTIDETLPALDVAFSAMDDFHPDRLLPLVDAMGGGAGGQVAARQTATAPTPAAAPNATPSGPASTAASTPTTAAALSSASLLDDMLDAAASPASSAASTARPARSDELSKFIEHAVAPHLVRRPDAGTAADASAQHQESARRLRLVLHHPRVQALEAAWRAVEMLVRRLDTDGELQIFVVDLPRAHVAPMLERLARERAASGGDEWALVVALHEFPNGDAGAEALARVAIAAGELGAPCVAAAPASIVGHDSARQLADDERAAANAPEVYTLIRRSHEGRYLGLTYPRVLLRAPYGHDNPCDTIELEEIEDPGHHDDFLWGSGAALVALLVGEAFLEHGWAIGHRLALEVGSLPFFTYRRGPEALAIPCAEITMSERVARHLLSRGVMPLASIKGTDRVRLVELRSVADPAAPFAAAWAGVVRA